ncbi:MAG: hypothetical protein OXF48_09900 [Bacteroidetes bacterium]|nr:hypothetical protein [Bacteroidota bacterium]
MKKDVFRITEAVNQLDSICGTLVIITGENNVGVRMMIEWDRG